MVYRSICVIETELYKHLINSGPTPPLFAGILDWLCAVNSLPLIPTFPNFEQKSTEATNPIRKSQYLLCSSAEAPMQTIAIITDVWSDIGIEQNTILPKFLRG